MLDYLDDRRCGIEREFMHNGDTMSQREFHKIYSKTLNQYKAELIAGIVYEPPPPSVQHGVGDADLSTLLAVYRAATPGTKSGVNTTVILSDKDEVQPDSHLRISPEAGGQASYWRNFIKGAPELAAEISFTSRSIDLHLKKDRYAKFGVKEYLVLCLEPNIFHWFDLELGTQPLPDDGGIIRSRIFPGLWLNTVALVNGDLQIALETLSYGLKSAEHKEFAELLASRVK